MSEDTRDQNDVVISSAGKPLFAGFLAFLVLFVGGGGWLGLASLSGAVIASGTVAVIGKPKTIQHLDGGIVEEIRVTDESVVKRGDLLVRLNDTLLKANIEIYSNRLRSSLANKARLEAEQAGLLQVNWDNAGIRALNITPDQAMRLSQKKMFDVRRATMLGQVAQMKEKISQYRNQIKGVTGLVESKDNQGRLIRRELKPLKRLLKRGNTTQTRVMSLQRQQFDLQGQVSEHKAELARIENSINETEIKMLQIRHEYQEKALGELRKMQQEINDMVQQLLTTREKLKRVRITAPVDGMIHQLSVFTIGGVITPGAAVMQIVPQGEAIEVEARIEPQFIDSLFIGQQARLLFSAFNQKSTPELDGTVKSISPSTITDEKTGMSFYTIRLSVAKSELARLGKNKLVPGMPVETFIRTTDRTPLNYLVKPLMDQMNRAFREE